MSGHRSFAFDPPAALRLHGADCEALPRLARPAFPPDAYRTLNPVANFGEHIAEQFADPTVTNDDLDRATLDLTVSEFYSRFLWADRTARLDPKTIALDVEALSWLVSVGVPKGWPVSPGAPAYAGPPIGRITSTWIDSLVAESLDNGLSENTVAKYLRHLRHILYRAAELGLIDRLRIRMPSADVSGRPFTDEECEHIFRSLSPEPVMQVAFVLALATGARFSDLFWFDWSMIDTKKRQLAFTAEKTGKFQVVPLTRVPLLHLSTLPRDRPPFCTLVDQTCPAASRGDSQHVHKLNGRWRELTGFAAPPALKRDWPEDAVPNPWHSARATAGMMVERRVAGMASRLLGHSEKSGERTTRMHYLVPVVPADLRAAAESVEWPECFRTIEHQRQKTLFD